MIGEAASREPRATQARSLAGVPPEEIAAVGNYGRESLLDPDYGDGARA